MRARTMVRKNSDAFFPRRERKESEEAVTRSTPRSNRTASSDGSDVYFLPASTMERRSMHDPRTRPREFVWFREKPKCFSRMGARRKPGIRKRIEIFFSGEEARWERRSVKAWRSLNYNTFQTFNVNYSVSSRVEHSARPFLFTNAKILKLIKTRPKLGQLFDCNGCNRVRNLGG